MGKSTGGSEVIVSRLTSHELFDIERYPIHERGSPAYQDMLRSAREILSDQNCAQLRNFIRPSVLAAMRAESNRLVPEAVFTEGNLNPYFTTPSDDLPEDHPVRRLYPRRHGMVRGDKFLRDGAIWSSFQNADLCAFVADCLGYEKLYTYRDPYGCVCVNVQPAGREFPWHFDTNDFTISLGLKQPSEGGVFEFVPDLRTDEDENYEEVKKVLDGDRTKVRSLVLRPGDLQLFRGGYSLHRVTAPVGEERHSLLLSYVTDPNKITSPETAIRFWGEAHANHFAAERRGKAAD